MSTGRHARFIVTAITRPGVAIERVGHAAVAKVEGWLGTPDKSRYDRLIEAVDERLRTLPPEEFGGPDRVEQVLSTTSAHFESAGLSVEELVQRRLDLTEAVAEQQRRFDSWPPGQGRGLAPLCRDHVIPAVFAGLFADESALRDIDLAFKRAVLSKLDEIRASTDETGEALADWLGAAALRDPAWDWVPGMADSALLQAEFAIVPFEPRVELAQGVRLWCESPAPLGIRLYVGPGGMGKTRFLMQVCRDMSTRGWRTGFVERLPEGLDDWCASLVLRTGSKLLVVVDYAEYRDQDVALLLKHAMAASKAGKQVRVALAARGEGEWWDTLRRRSGLAQALLSGTVTEPTIPIGPLAMDAPTRRHCFDSAATAFAGRIEKDVGPLRIRPNLDGEHFASILMVHMSALATVEGRSLGTAQALHDFMLDREARTWERGLKGPKLGTLDADDVLQAMAMVNFAGGIVGLDDARATIGLAPRLQHQPRPVIDDLARLLARLYPRVDQVAKTNELRIEPLRPDILGERLIARALEKEPRLLEVAFAS